MENQLRDWLKENDDKLSRQEEPYRHFDRVRWSAKSRKLEFNLTIDDFIYPSVCPILGIPISRELSRSHWPSIDRVDNSKGYLKGNVRVISFKANALKGSNTLETLEALVQYMKGSINEC